MERLCRTHRYEMFENDPTNRNQTNLKKLLASMTRHGFIASFPITVIRRDDSTLLIKDGGHRFEAAKKLSLPIYYVVIENAELSIPEINDAQRKWALTDYLDAFVRMGNEEYIALKEFRDLHRLPLSVCARLLYGEQAISGNADKVFKNGTFRVKNKAYAATVAEILVGLRDITKIDNNVLFISAVSKCCLLPEFSAPRFIRNATRLAHTMTPRATLDDYLDMIETIYNSHTPRVDQLPVKFMAKKASDERNACIPGGRSKRAPKQPEGTRPFRKVWPTKSEIKWVQH